MQRMSDTANSEEGHRGATILRRPASLLHPLPALSPSMHPGGGATFEPQGWIPMPPTQQPLPIRTKALVHQWQCAVIEASWTQCSLGALGISSSALEWTEHEKGRGVSQEGSSRGSSLAK